MVDLIKLIFLLFLATHLVFTHPHEEAATHSSKETYSTPIFGLATEVAERKQRDVSGEPSSTQNSTTVASEREKREEIELGDADEERKEPDSSELAGLETANSTNAGSKEKHEDQELVSAAETGGEQAKKEKREEGTKEVPTDHAYRGKRDSKESEHAKKEKREIGSKESELAKKEKRAASSKEAAETTTLAKRAVRVKRNGNMHKNRPLKPSRPTTTTNSEPHP